VDSDSLPISRATDATLKDSGFGDSLAQDGTSRNMSPEAASNYAPIMPAKTSALASGGSFLQTITDGLEDDEDTVV
jgi:hypothetical protein